MYQPSLFGSVVCLTALPALHRYWGGYVAAFAGGEQPEVMRDPSGALPCYWARHDNQTLFASDVELLVAAGAIRPEIDWSGIWPIADRGVRKRSSTLATTAGGKSAYLSPSMWRHG